MRMRAAVIGANGFLGRKLVQLCQQRGWEVHGIYHHARKHIPQDCPSFSSKELEKLDPGYDIVFAAASYIPYGDMDAFSKKLFESNILLPISLLKKFMITKRLVFISSVSVYGNHNKVITENSPLNNPNTYGMSKLVGEFISRFHPHSSIIRFSSLYGTGMRDRTFLPKIIHSAVHERKIILRGDGSRKQDYLHVADAAEWCILIGLKGKKGKVYLGVNGQSYSNLEVARLVQKYAAGCLVEFKGEDRSCSFHYNNQWTRQELNFSPRYSLEEGIKELVEEYE